MHKTLMHALMIWTVYIYVWCLVLSAFELLAYIPLALLYAVTNLIMIIYLVHMGGRPSLFLLVADIKEYLIEQIHETRKDRIDTFLTVLIVLFVFGLGIVACFAVPYNYDSIDYHAPRICFWVQNRSVAYYATEVTRQAFSPVLASYVATFAYILAGKWQSAMCIIQYGAYVINLLLILHLCQMLGVKKRMRQLAAVLWITLPIGFAEAITPQNDQCASMWLLMFAIELMYLIRKIREEKNYTWNTKEDFLSVAILAISISLGYLTKPSVCFAMVIFLCAYLIVCIQKGISIRNIVLQCIIALVLILILICPQMIQNYLVMGTLSSDLAGKRQLVGTLKPNYLFVNMIKDMIHNLGFSIASISNEELISRFVYRLGSLLNVEVDHVSISEDGVLYGFPSLPCYSCDAALNSTAYILSIFSVVLYCLCKKRFDKDQKLFIVSSIFSFVFLCMALRWEKSITRYMIGYFSLLIVSVVCVLDVVISYYSDKKAEGKIRKKLIAGIIICISLMIGYDVYNELSDLYKLHPVFAVKSALTMYHDKLDDYYEACDYINNMDIEELGLIESGCPGDYAIWRMLDENIVIRSVNLPENNPLKVLERTDIAPQAILSYEDRGDHMECHGQSYYLCITNSSWNVYCISE